MVVAVAQVDISCSPSLGVESAVYIYIYIVAMTMERSTMLLMGKSW